MAEITTRQSAVEYSDIRELYKLKDDNAVEDMAALKADIAALINIINTGDLVPIQGVGSPEGIVTSNSSLTYIDTTLEPASVTMYVNQSINSTTGWIPVI